MDTAGRARGAERHLLEFGGYRNGFRAHRGWTLFDGHGVIQRALCCEAKRELQERRLFRQFLETIDHQVPPRFALHLIIDNYATHKTPAIKRCC